MLSTWFDHIRDVRNRKVADRGFRRRAMNSALTKSHARHQTGRLFDLAAGFVYSQILGACVRCGLFDTLAERPLDVPEIARRVRLPDAAAERLLKAAAALDLVEARSGGRYALGSLGAALVDNPGVTAMILHHDILYRDLADPLALLRNEATPELGRYWTYAGKERNPSAEPGDHAGYTELMASSQALVTAEILDAYTFTRHRRLLDIGGGDGSFLIAVGHHAPQLKLTLFDLPAVADTARETIRGSGIGDRTTVVGGNLFEDELPAGFDVAVLNRVLHDHDDEAALAILRAARRAIVPGGTLLVAEPMAGTPGAKPSGDAYFGLYLFAMGQGRPRTGEEIGALLHRAGFERITPVSTNVPVIARIIAARPAVRRPQHGPLHKAAVQRRRAGL